jgi:hypothetical protein
MTSNSSNVDQPFWKRRLALAVTVTTTAFGLVAFVANSQRVIELIQDYVPASVGRFLPSSAAARFNQGATALLANSFITDERLEHYFGKGQNPCLQGGCHYLTERKNHQDQNKSARYGRGGLCIGWSFRPHLRTSVWYETPSLHFEGGVVVLRRTKIIAVYKPAMARSDL